MAKPPNPAARAAPAPQTSPKEAGVKDLVLVHGQTPDGTLHVLRRRGGKVEAGAMRPVEDGKPVTGELVQLSPRGEMPLLFDAETVYQPPVAQTSRETEPDGPAQVANEAYRKNWSRIFGAAKRRVAATALPN